MKIFHDLLTYSYGDFQKADFVYKMDLATRKNIWEVEQGRWQGKLRLNHNWNCFAAVPFFKTDQWDRVYRGLVVIMLWLAANDHSKWNCIGSSWQVQNNSFLNWYFLVNAKGEIMPFRRKIVKKKFCSIFQSSRLKSENFLCILHSVVSFF